MLWIKAYENLWNYVSSLYVIVRQKRSHVHEAWTQFNMYEIVQTRNNHNLNT